MLLYPSGILPSDKSLLEIESIYFATLSSWLFNPDSSKLDSLNAVRKSSSSFFLDWSESFILKDFSTDMRHQKQKRKKVGSPLSFTSVLRTLGLLTQLGLLGSALRRCYPHLLPQCFPHLQGIQLLPHPETMIPVGCR